MKNKLVLVVFVLLVIFVMTGCSSAGSEWKKKLQVSELKYNDDYIVFDVKNLTDKYYSLNIVIESKNGSIKDENSCLETIKPNEKKEIECLILDIDEDYKNTIKNITFTEKEIPNKTTELGANISLDELKYYYDKVYTSHTLSMTGFAFNKDESNMNYPYIDEITYNLKDEVTIVYTIKDDNNIVATSSAYDTITGNLKEFIVITDSSNIELQAQVESRISSLYYFIDNDFDTLAIYKAIRTPVDDGKCYRVGTWCFAKYVDEKNETASYVASGR